MAKRTNQVTQSWNHWLCFRFASCFNDSNITAFRFVPIVALGVQTCDTNMHMRSSNEVGFSQNWPWRLATLGLRRRAQQLLRNYSGKLTHTSNTCQNKGFKLSISDLSVAQSEPHAHTNLQQANHLRRFMKVWGMLLLGSTRSFWLVFSFELLQDCCPLQNVPSPW